LLSDRFIYELAFYVRTGAPNIMARTLSKYLSFRGKVELSKDEIDKSTITSEQI
jgi:hypothetical protein